MEQTYESIFPEKEVRYATFGKRFWAGLIDLIIMLLVFSILEHIYARPQYTGKDFLGGLLFSSHSGYTYLEVFIELLYQALFVAGPWQATPGKKLMKIKVTTLEGHRLTILYAAIRYLGKYISSAILFVGFLMMLWDKKKQTLHDKMAGSIVVMNS